MLFFKKLKKDFIMKDFRQISLEILNDVFITKRWAKESMQENMHDIDAPHNDIKKIYELVYGILRNKNYIDFNINRFIKRQVKDIKLLNILRIGYYQLKYMRSIPAYAAINVCVQLTKINIHPNVSGFVNAVLRNILRSKETNIKIPDKDKVEYFCLKYSYEPWMIRFLLKYYPDETEEILKAGNFKHPVFIKTNTVKINTDELLNELKKRNIEAEKIKKIKEALYIKKGDVINTDLFEKGFFYVQDISSQILGIVVDADKDDAIIDIGSAPGGKSAFFSIAMKNKGQIIAIEPKKERIKIMEQNFLRLGLTNINILQHDATTDIPAFHNKADKIILDAPCSALGIIRRHPEKKWCLKEEELKEFPVLQIKILETIKKWVKKGGFIYYSTCTINPDENQNVIEKFINKNKDYKIENVFKNLDLNPKEYKNDNFFQALPGNELNMDGFFIAKIKRIK